MQIPRRKSDLFKKRDDGPVHLTEEGLKRLREQLERLKKSLPDLIGEASHAAAYGDRSENDEYKESKSRLRSAHRQILSIQDQIKRAVVIKMGSGVSGKVRLGSTVVLEIDGERKIFQIVGSQETNPAKGRISHQSPLGAALLNHKKGDTVKIHPPTGGANSFQEYRILEIK
ncbi:MAG: hypothetical protein A3I24_02145 [Candidatus Harrisonbacteria bacterium RIFCSPLOWO2_02_FULL_41_13b]|uniref:Transcription elongation factor GreA n=1 Tax=Candidatus Harrisonbacteria bacterium RIFCSPLOWO2_02_FULL_41_13b TaxID=1798409 RepID=A0A1G1ZUZ1_9BACT|nr:MAG: hypothetical protein A3J53_01005 [Candidatus Harrisonbacteria bacterium RIFCSPHIGHO2_02_FULL_40_20]OGY67946.1 MAG: hypothetical protein A3I24_02145 [Candidatus Harrisonbacteria bacterium RIFCSPLOWO2_02_FULL_41_13b]